MMIDDATLQNALDACPTPLYLFDHQVLNDRITRLRASLPSRIKLCYAMKANPFIVLEASALAACVEACSPGEVLICANAGVPFEKIVLSGVWKDRRCLDDLFQADRIPHRFTIESSQQLKDLVELANAYRRRVNVLFRLSSENQFGVDSATLKELIAGCKDDPFISIQGIQYYSGTQKTSLKKLDRELNKLHRIVAEVEAACSVKLNEIEYGPGFRRVHRRGRERLAARGRTRCRACNAAGRFPLSRGRRPRAGTRIAADCGAYRPASSTSKRRAGQNYAIVDGGMSISYYGHSMAMSPRFRKVGATAGAAQPWNICGRLHGQRHPGQASADRRFWTCLRSLRRAHCATGRGCFRKDLPSVIGCDSSCAARHRQNNSFNSSNGRRINRQSGTKENR
ncbi:MAG: alanine racemase [Eggerthella lenta]